jgi:hypothetical protein
MTTIEVKASAWLAIWNTRRSVAYALDFHPSELVTCELELRRARRAAAIASPVRSTRCSKRKTLPSRN